jgi:hypothetical protein
VTINDPIEFISERYNNKLGVQWDEPVSLTFHSAFNKPGRHKQFLFLIGWFLKNRLRWNRFTKWIKTWKVLYKNCSFISDPLTNMTATGNSCFWLVDFLKKNRLRWNRVAKWIKTWKVITSTGHSILVILFPFYLFYHFVLKYLKLIRPII